ncbi:hypothetical protein NDU88_007885 [Pleurodeles waltl]|uniref:Uncharacterized protein n=1 Tax=Pleurodeles waltl TaxID=8319 RepID=A0AAV7QQ82_PLEWA|nr:hypothetical protein NDU88_007885 [Pleurodeles waltl]
MALPGFGPKYYIYPVGAAVLLLLWLRGLLEPRALPPTGAAAPCELSVAVRGWLGGAGLGSRGAALAGTHWRVHRALGRPY